MLISSYYSIENGNLVVKFGFLADSYPIKEVDNIIKNVRTNALFVNFKDDSTLRIVIDKNNFDDFSATIIKENKDVCYGETDEIDRSKGKSA